ncbi:uncharacterized protein LOC111713560 isoform X2 [Eurytemora carolleeae]|uniref:uncharacterized protein LOC111713560 isoform X2 n=1 Tax=Eurytemora carolleeae TaxID=1294199 RepID=UPI000C78CA99|nr:uncharacterized protein LOC111713560 isoform X2 [Eurytemora carolleeae]|eukprot:XP_023344210.1 uncharacterized protein LOC111713560 isoform X2 [Eurytemora affinis]
MDIFRVKNEKLEEQHEVLVEKMDGWRGKYFTILGFFVCFIIIFIIIVLVLIIKLKNKKKKSRSNMGSPALSRGHIEEQEPLTPRDSGRTAGIGSVL